MPDRNPKLAPRALAAAALALTVGCYAPMIMTDSDADVVLANQVIPGPSPAEPGEFQVGYLTYGSGTDLNRGGFADSVAIVTDSIDGSDLLTWGGQREDREEYWGFSIEGLPLNGRVWYPEGEGRFPLVLVVHGNHSPTDYSDPGYDYLGELLASRGYILVSLDMNFINGISRENDGRGWMMLEHIRAWTEFDADPSNPFAGKVDLDNIAIMGHSRGGEAVTHAVAFNQLDRYPDDANVTFDYGYSIKSVVAIAPVDGQYEPTGRKVPLQNVNYLVFHGSHDGDVTSFHGLRPYHRVEYTDGQDYFKSAVYMYRANHGQWNSVWNSFDRGPRSARSLDLRYLVDPADQRRFAEVYVSAFLDATLKGQDQWLSLFRDHRVAGDWLPKTMYITRMQGSDVSLLAGFEGDIDVTTGASEGITLRGDSLSTWREETLALRSRNQAATSASQENQAVWLGWNNRTRGDTTVHGPTAQFVIDLPAGFARQNGIDANSSIDLALSATERMPSPRGDPRSKEEREAAEEGQPDEENEPESSDENEDAEDDLPPVDLSVEVEDGQGRTASVPLSAYGPIRRPLEIRILRRRDQEEGGGTTELVLQSYHIPISDFTAATPALDPSGITSVRLVFDQVAAGEVVVDDIAFSRLPAGFWESRIR